LVPARIPVDGRAVPALSLAGEDRVTEIGH
jgi:hypothetical protein